jgi:MFS family permease
MLGSVYCLSFLDRQLVSTLAEPIKNDLALSDVQLGLLSGFMFAVFYTGFGIPISWLADRWHRVRIVSIACALWSLFTAFCGVAQGFMQLAIARVGVGVGEAGGSPPSYSIIADHFPPERRGVALAL